MIGSILRIYDVDDKLLNGIKSKYACVRVKGGESECFRVNSGVRQGCIMSPWLFNVYMDAMMKEVKMEMGRRRARFQDEGREWRMSGLLYADDLVFCGELEEEMRAMVRCFVEVCKRRGLKVKAGKSKVMVLGREEGMECEVHIDRICLEHVLELNT